MIETIERCQGRRIASIEVDREANHLNIGFDGGDILRIWDDGQSCCENRYLSTDDDVAPYVGAAFVGAEIRDVPSEASSGAASDASDGEWDSDQEHEIAFLVVTTSRGAFTVANHNEHNGYYGGFDIEAKLIVAAEEAAAAAAREVKQKEGDRIKDLARLYAKMTSAEVTAHEAWVRRFKAEQAAKDDAEAK